MGPDAAGLFLDSIRENLTLVALDEVDYLRTTQSAAGVRVVGGAIYDAILGRCAVKARAEILYTWNTQDFLRLPSAIADRVRRPDQA